MPVPVQSDTGAAKNIWVAAGEGDLDRVRHLVEVEGTAINAADQWTYTPLHAAASYGQKDMLRFLLTHASAPANAVETTDDDGDTPLFVCEDVSVARMLVEEYNANAKHENKEGNTPAMAAEENEQAEVAAYFRSVTGEAPLYATLQDLRAEEAAAGLGEDNELEQAVRAAAPGSSIATDQAIDARTDALMEKVQEILQRAEQRGATSGEDLNAEEEAELRRVVGESLFSQIREGWGAVAAEQRQREEAGLRTEAGNANGSEPNGGTHGAGMNGSSMPGR